MQLFGKFKDWNWLQTISEYLWASSKFIVLVSTLVTQSKSKTQITLSSIVLLLNIMEHDMVFMSRKGPNSPIWNKKMAPKKNESTIFLTLALLRRASFWPRSMVYFHWNILALAGIGTRDLPSTKPICYQLSYPGLDMNQQLMWKGLCKYKGKCLAPE